MEETQASPARPARTGPRVIHEEIWKLARIDYLMGETAAVVAKRYDIGIDNLRKRQITEGWTRKAMREAGEGPKSEEEVRLEAAARRELEALSGRGGGERRARPRFDLGLTWHPAPAMSQAAAEAARLIAEGRGKEAQVVIRAAESLGRLTGYRPVPQERYAKDLYGQEAKKLEWYRSFEREVRDLASWMAIALLSDSPADLEQIKPWRRGFVFPWRAEILVPGTAREDFERYGGEPWAADVWHEDGRLRSREEIDARSLRRHRDEWRAAVGLPTDPALWAEADVAARVFPDHYPPSARQWPGWVTE
jgi:hypothetical protein